MTRILLLLLTALAVVYPALSTPRSEAQPVPRDHGTAVGVSADVAEPQSGAPKEGHSPAGPGLSLAAAIPLSAGAPLHDVRMEAGGITTGGADSGFQSASSADLPVVEP